MKPSATSSPSNRISRTATGLSVVMACLCPATASAHSSVLPHQHAAGLEGDLALLPIVLATAALIGVVGLAIILQRTKRAGEENQR
ncbi:hypothetical protein FYK55_04395 [Roseiconus nitratireducens]|uniref:Uncharacterized protein n=1 Tax=Roseiconus nitratireducens TaxID=2605748 RepID=A0A5M6DIU2_9BACT|nr:hypothetical protein [Roseiconus nitratireducens]KAA5546142.1 hypothetical protein FYK55_04395 [Roseiconus nitratireducens]